MTYVYKSEVSVTRVMVTLALALAAVVVTGNDNEMHVLGWQEAIGAVLLVIALWVYTGFNPVRFLGRSCRLYNRFMDKPLMTIKK